MSRKIARKLAPLGLILTIAACSAIIVVGLVTWFFVSIPSGKDLQGCLTAQMFNVPLCPKSASYTRLKQISPHLKNAVVASEDAAFWDHHGIDWDELQKSIETNMSRGRFARGGSTITQQLAKNVYLSSEKSIFRKVREAVIALRLERLYNKELLLERYLNVVEFDQGIYGAQAAAQHYFHQLPENLTVAQSAWLAFVLPNPKKYSVSFHKKHLTYFALKQMREIINRLYRFKKINDVQRETSLREAAALFGGVSGDDQGLAEELMEEDSPEPEPAKSMPSSQETIESTTIRRLEDSDIPTMKPSEPGPGTDSDSDSETEPEPETKLPQEDPPQE